MALSVLTVSVFAFVFKASVEHSRRGQKAFDDLLAAQQRMALESSKHSRDDRDDFLWALAPDAIFSTRSLRRKHEKARSRVGAAARQFRAVLREVVNASWVYAMSVADEIRFAGTGEFHRRPPERDTLAFHAQRLLHASMPYSPLRDKHDWAWYLREFLAGALRSVAAVLPTLSVADEQRRFVADYVWSLLATDAGLYAAGKLNANAENALVAYVDDGRQIIEFTPGQGLLIAEMQGVSQLLELTLFVRRYAAPHWSARARQWLDELADSARACIADAQVASVLDRVDTLLCDAQTDGNARDAVEACIRRAHAVAKDADAATDVTARLEAILSDIGARNERELRVDLHSVAETCKRLKDGHYWPPEFVATARRVLKRLGTQ